MPIEEGRLWKTFYSQPLCPCSCSTVMIAQLASARLELSKEAKSAAKTHGYKGLEGEHSGAPWDRGRGPFAFWSPRSCTHRPTLRLLPHQWPSSNALPRISAYYSAAQNSRHASFLTDISREVLEPGQAAFHTSSPLLLKPMCTSPKFQQSQTTVGLNEQILQVLGFVTIYMLGSTSLTLHLGKNGFGAGQPQRMNNPSQA